MALPAAVEAMEWLRARIWDDQVMALVAGAGDDITMLRVKRLDDNPPQ